MSGSSAYGKTYTNGMMQQLNMMGLLDRIIDVGAGSGTYPKLMQNDLPEDVYWTGIEVWAPYITEYNLSDLYNDIINQDIREVDFSAIEKADLVLFGDILEHMTKEEAIQVCTDCLQNHKAFMISIPIVHYPQGPEHGNPYEEHIKDDWSHEEVMETFPSITSFFVHDHIGVYFGSLDEEFKAFLPSLHKKVSSLCQSLFGSDRILSS